MKQFPKPKPKAKSSIVVRNEKGQVMPGSPPINPNGKPPGILNFGGKTNRMRRDFLQTKLYEKLVDNYEMIYETALGGCNPMREDISQAKVKACFKMMEYMGTKLKDADDDNAKPMNASSSVEELQQQIAERFTELEKVFEERVEEAVQERLKQERSKER